MDGAYVVGGLAGFGSMMACAAGELAAAWVLGERLPDLAADFDPQRFRDLARSGQRLEGVQPAGEL